MREQKSCKSKQMLKMMNPLKTRCVSCAVLSQVQLPSDTVTKHSLHNSYWNTAVKFETLTYKTAFAPIYNHFCFHFIRLMRSEVKAKTLNKRTIKTHLTKRQEHETFSE